MGGLSIWQIGVLLIAIPIHLSPSIIAFVRDHSHKWAVVAINVLTGWTGIGWIVALVWALIGKKTQLEAAHD